MEINKYQDIRGALTKASIPEGRLVLIVDHSQTHNQGSREELVAVKVPATSGEAAKAKYAVTWPVDNQAPPIYESLPAFPFALREGFDQAANVPFTAKVRMTQPSMQEGQAIPSGFLALAFGPGVYTVPSGAYVDSVNLIPGNYLIAADTASDGAGEAGKPKYSASATPIEVVRKDSEGRLTFRINY